MAKLVPIGAAINIVQALNPPIGAPSLAAILGIPGTGRLPRRLFEVQVSGSFSCAADSTLTVTIQAGTDTNPANNTTIASSGAIAMTAANDACSYSGTLRLIYNKISGRLEGSQSWIVNNIVVTRSALATVIPGLNDANEPVLNLVHGVALGTANASSYILPDTFAIEA